MICITTKFNDIDKLSHTQWGKSDLRSTKKCDQIQSKAPAKIENLFGKLVSESSLLDKSSCLVTALCVTKFITMIGLNLDKLFCTA
jgi:hypothetical protein